MDWVNRLRERSGAKKKEPAETAPWKPCDRLCRNSVGLTPVPGASPDAHLHKERSQFSREGERYKLIELLMGW